MNLVCSECGHAQFTAKHSAVVERTYEFDASGNENWHTETVVEVERDVDTFACDDCGNEVEGAGDLITEEAYNHASDDLIGWDEEHGRA